MSSSSSAPEPLATLLAESLDALAREVPEAYERLCRELEGQAIALRVDTEAFAVVVARGDARVVAQFEPVVAEFTTSRRAIVAMLDGEQSLTEAVLTDALKVRASLDDLVRLNRGLLAYVNGALRSPTHPALLARFRGAGSPPASPMPPTRARSEIRPDPDPTIRRGVVTVVGAGVAGLTAAQALAERGFTVRMLGATPDRSDPSSPPVRIGGWTRTRYHQDDRLYKFDPASPEPPRDLQLPSEHGLRLVRPWHRHLLDTLRRIPLSGFEGGQRRKTVYDNLVALPRVISEELGSRPFLLPGRRATSLGEVLNEVRGTAGAKLAMSDLLTYFGRLLRYASTSSERRAGECRTLSLQDYLQGTNSATSQVSLTYSERFLSLLRNMPRSTPVALPYRDARTDLNIAVQLIRNILGECTPDRTFDGQTNDAWLRHWQAHLEGLGVELRAERLDRFSIEDGELKAWITDASGTTSAWSSDYFIAALGPIAAAAVTRDLPAHGVAGALSAYITDVPAAPPGQPSTHVLSRDPCHELGISGWDRLRHTGGLQFFFHADIGALEGFRIHVGTPWSLSTLALSPAPAAGAARDGDLIQLRVAIGDWTSPGLDDHPAAAQSLRHEIAREVWRQVRRSTQAVGDGPAPPDPVWYTFDDAVLFRRSWDEPTPAPDGQGPAAKFLAPALMTIVNEWDQRPGAAPWDPTDPEARCTPTGDPVLWQSPSGGYLVHWDKLVFAGTYKKTFTRETGLEAACESALHAVNALLAHAHSRTSGAETGDPDYCRIWNPERSELPALATARQLDRALFRAGLPHSWVGLDHMTSLLFTVMKGTPPRTPTDDGMHRSSDANRDGRKGLGHDVLRRLQQLRQRLEDAARPRTR